MTFKINTFLIGVQKAGTSTFWSWLTQHPEVYGPVVMKDYHFFTRKEWRNKGIDHLHSFYKEYQGESIVMQGGVNYYFELEFINQVLDYQPEGKYILILRDPVERAWSAFQYFTKLGQEKRSINQALEDELIGRNKPEDRHRYAYLEHGLYGKYLQLLLNQIPRERLLILQYRDLFNDPETNLRRTFKFLDIDPEFQVNTTVSKNKTGQVRFSWLNEILFSKRGIVGLIKKYIPLQKLMPLSWRIKLGNVVRDMNVIAGKEKPVLSEKDRAFMEDFFREDQEELKGILKMDR